MFTGVCFEDCSVTSSIIGASVTVHCNGGSDDVDGCAENDGRTVWGDTGTEIVSVCGGGGDDSSVDGPIGLCSSVTNSCNSV